jgi:hypothetical protein
MEKLSESKLYEYSNNDTGIIIVSYLGFERYIEIPDSIDGNTVTEIGDKAFINCKEAEGIWIPNTVTTIGEEAFKGCDKLYSIFIPSTIVEIGVDCFTGCSKLKVLCNEGSYALKYARHNGLTAEKYEPESEFGKSLIRVVDNWYEILRIFGQPERTHLKKSKPSICSDTLVLTNTGLAYDYLSLNVDKVRNIISSWLGQNIKVSIVESDE